MHSRLLFIRLVYNFIHTLDQSLPSSRPSTSKMFAGLIPGLNSVNWPENEVSPQVPAILTSLFNLSGQAFSATNATLFTQSLGFSRRDWSGCRSFVLLIYFCIFILIVVFASSSGKEESDEGGDTATEEAGESPETDDNPGSIRVFRNGELFHFFFFNLICLFLL